MERAHSQHRARWVIRSFFRKDPGESKAASSRRTPKPGGTFANAICVPARWRKSILFLLFFLGALSPNLRAAVGENALPKADWLSANPGAETAQTVYFRKSFLAPPKLVKSVLLGACDERLTLFLNGEPAGEIRGHDRATSLDVTRHLRPGENLLAVRVEHTQRLAAFRLMLEMATEGGRQSWVASDSSWTFSLTESRDWQKPAFAAAGWKPALSHGEAGLERWGNAFDATKSIDAYNSWMLASGAAKATDPATLTVPPQFEVELLRSALPEEGSWVSLAFDPERRLTIAREKRGLLRLTFQDDAVENVEVIDDTLLECRGLLYAHGALYVNANNEKRFYRLRDTDRDGRFDEKTLLLETAGGVGHGRNQLRLGPDGFIYLVHGNDVALPPKDIDPSSPLRHTATDQLFPQRWGEHGSTPGIVPPHGYVMRTDKDGRQWHLVAGGLRNALDIDFNYDGEMFTYDADNERDIATPWYKPTRVLHVTSGAEYGWRVGAGKVPAYVPDNLPSAIDIGVGSPCGVEFGKNSRFPRPYHFALFIADWAYGRILAIHLEPDGASYRGTAEPFVTGRPLNVTDMVIGPDGHMYFTTGGRRTQSGLYRVKYTGPHKTEPPPYVDPRHAELRALRRKLEAFHSGEVPGSLDTIWPHLAHSDRFIRFAARIALEAQSLALWEEKAFAEKDTTTALGALLAVTRVTPVKTQERVFKRLLEFPVAALNEQQLLESIRVAQVSCARGAQLPPELSTALAAHFEPAYPSKSQPLNHELCRLLIYLRSPHALEKTITLLTAARSTEDLLHYLWHLRHLHAGWTLDQRRTAFEALARAEQFQGAREYLQALRDIRKDFTDALTPAERDVLGALLTHAPVAVNLPPIDYSKYRFVQHWKLTDFSRDDLAPKGNAEAGREPFAAAQCIVCHRVGQNGGGNLGPDLTAVAARFNRRDLLQHILEPSAVIDDKFRSTTIALKNNAGTYAGYVQADDAQHLHLSTGPGPDDFILIEKSQIESQIPSPVSSMPPGLLNSLTKEQILNLLAYLEAGGASK